MFADSHAHLTCDPVYERIDELVERAAKAQVDTIVNICIDKLSLERAQSYTCNTLRLAHAGCTTPHDVEEQGERYFSSFEVAAERGFLSAIGETGLDYYYDHLNRDAQKAYFIRCMELARKCNLPLVIHCREAFPDLFRLLDEYYNKETVLLHCFTGGDAEVDEANARGFMLSLSGIITFKKSEALRAAAKRIPLDKLLIETDTPYLAPQSQRGKQNEPSNIPETAACVAGLFDCSLAELARQTKENTHRFFSLS